MRLKEDIHSRNFGIDFFNDFNRRVYPFSVWPNFNCYGEEESLHIRIMYQDDEFVNIFEEVPLMNIPTLYHMLISLGGQLQTNPIFHPSYWNSPPPPHFTTTQ